MKLTYLSIAQNGELPIKPVIRAHLKSVLVEGKPYRVTIAKASRNVSDELRGYMFGAVIPFIKEIVPTWAPLTDEQVYEVLKKNFNGFIAFNPVTGRNERYGQSVLTNMKENEQARNFIERIAGWVRDNYALELPNPEDYKTFRDSAPFLNNPK
jgi:hypothetical protein